MKLRSLTGKITVSTLVCILVAGIFSYTYLYQYLFGLVRAQAEQVEDINIHDLKTRLDTGLQQFSNLCNISVNNFTVSQSLTHQSLDTVKARKDATNAHEKLIQYLMTSAVNDHVEKFMVFNKNGVAIQGTANNNNSINDYQKVMELSIFEDLELNGDNYLLYASPSIVPGNENKLCLAFVGKVISSNVNDSQGWLYAELSDGFFSEILRPYAGSNVFVSPQHEVNPIATRGEVPQQLQELLQENPQDGQEITEDGKTVYQVRILDLKLGDIAVYSLSDITMFTSRSPRIYVPIVIVSLISVLAVILLAVAIHFILNRPLKRLVSRIKKISDNDFSFDPVIEQGHDEIAEVGKVINEMSHSIDLLMKETIEIYEQKKNTEIALLQSQVNPHFLYNTLDSIHWMAVIQKKPGIAKTVRCLSNLLRNLAKGIGNKITLEEELSLLEDYIEIQKIRFMEMFDIKNHIPQEFYHCFIIKFTLQPLIENAIYHGLEPLGKNGMIELNAVREGNYLLIVIEDNGVGMTPEQLKELMKNNTNPHQAGMAGIGVANVDSRLKLTYGPECGLTYESEPGKYTRVTVRIPMEMEEGYGSPI